MWVLAQEILDTYFPIDMLCMTAQWEDHMATFHTPHGSVPTPTGIFFCLHAADVCRASGRGVAPAPVAVVTRFLDAV